MTQKELTDRLDLASRQYYNGLTSEFSDTEFDLKLKELQKMEAESGIVLPNSPTNRVGSDIQEGFEKGEHPHPMFTIENVYNDEELEKWFDDCYTKYKVKTYNVSIKYDGISCELWYKGGVFCKALTRGNKIVGDDITENVKTIKNIPMKLDYPFIGDEMFYVRGEILLPKSKLESINEERIAYGEQPFANTRNACGGSIKQLNPKVTAKRGLIFKAWDCFGRIEFQTMEEKIAHLEKCGFYYEDLSDANNIISTRPFTISYCKDKPSHLFIINSFKEALNNTDIDYDFDGIVIKFDNVSIQEKIGTKDTRAIEWGIARKWNEENEAETVLEGIDWQVGRTGVLTPVGRLTPVDCNGVVISNVTLHNWGFIEFMGINIGDVLRITRSGGVIPYVIGRRAGEYTLIPQKPKYCPACGSDVRQDGALIKCINYNCSAQTMGRVLQFCSKDCMDIRSVGERVVEDLVLLGVVEDVCDLYTLKERYTVAELVDILGEGYGIKSVEKMLEAIEVSKEKPFANVIASLSIPNVGKVVARQLAQEFKNIDNLINCTYNQLVAIDGVGEIMADDICWWFSAPKNVIMCENLKKYGLTMEVPVETETISDGILNGLTLCFTGSSFKFKGDEVEKFLEENGAKCVHSVSKKLNYLIIGDKPGASKVKKAEDAGVTIITETDFYNKFNLS